MHLSCRETGAVDARTRKELSIIITNVFKKLLSGKCLAGVVIGDRNKRYDQAHSCGCTDLSQAAESQIVIMRIGTAAKKSARERIADASNAQNNVVVCRNFLRIDMLPAIFRFYADQKGKAWRNI